MQSLKSFKTDFGRNCVVLCVWNNLILKVYFPASRGRFSFVFAELTDGTKRDLCHGSKLPLIQPPSMVVDGGFRNACSLYCLLTVTWAHCIARIPLQLFRCHLVSPHSNMPYRQRFFELQTFCEMLQHFRLLVYGRVNYTFDCKFVSKSLFNWGILHIPYCFRKSFEKRAQFASPNALQNNLHIERNRLRVASLEERIERVWSSETSKGVF